MPANRSSVTATQVTAAGDLITTSSKLISNGTPIPKMATLVSEDSRISVGTHSRVGPSVSSKTTVSSTSASPCIVSLRPHGDARANAFASSEREPELFPFSARETELFPFSARETGKRETGLFRLSSTPCTVTSSFTGAYFGHMERRSMVPPPLRPNFLGEYGHGIRGYIPPYVRDVPDRFGLSLPRPSVTEEPVGMPPAAMAADWQVPVLQTATQTVPVTDNHYRLATSRPSVMGEPQEVPRVAIPVTQWMEIETEALQEVPKVDVRPRTARTQLAPEDDAATALRDRRPAEYEDRLQRSQARHVVRPENGPREGSPRATTGMGLMRGAGHGYLLHPSQTSRPSRQAADVTDSPWTRHQQRAHRMVSEPVRGSEAIPRDVPEREMAEEFNGRRVARKPVSQPWQPCPMEIPDFPSEGEETDDGYVGYPPLPPGIKPKPLLPRYGEHNRGGERLSRRDWFELPRRGVREDVHNANRYEAPQRVPDTWVPTRPSPVAHLAKMQDFQGEGSDRLDAFFDHVEELADFYRWDERETCRQARAHLRGTALAYVKRAPFQPRCWEELKALLLKRFQPRDLTATYKAQFRSRRRRHNEDIHTFVEAVQRLADMAWPFMDSQAKEELVVNQFLLGMENHELNEHTGTDVSRTCSV